MRYVLLVLALTALAVATRPLAVLRIACAPSRAVAMAAPTLVLCTHDYEHVDLFCMRREARAWRARFGVATAFVVADRLHNHAFCRLVHRGACIAVRGGTTAAVLDKLRTHHVVLFVYRGTQSTGACHMARAAARTVVARVTLAEAPGPVTHQQGYGACDIVRKTCGSTASVAYAPLRADPRADPRAFLRALKRQLYPKKMHREPPTACGTTSPPT